MDENISSGYCCQVIHVKVRLKLTGELGPYHLSNSCRECVEKTCEQVTATRYIYMLHRNVRQCIPGRKCMGPFTRVVCCTAPTITSIPLIGYISDAGLFWPFYYRATRHPPTTLYRRVALQFTAPALDAMLERRSGSTTPMPIVLLSLSKTTSLPVEVKKL
ncbi:hypothetical protein J6590_092185 [Homalodisca vitripennis]|nr:hypothetical protein J6590_092185 [Homalodisca vitripennis]